MDYLTKPVSRSTLRELAIVLRKLFSVKQTGKMPVLMVLEQFSTIFPNSYYEIVEDEEMPATIPAQCRVLQNGGFQIKIRQSIYDGAYQENVGAFLDHIMHEICHAFLYSIGYRPIMSRSFKPGQIKSYCSSEWQAKALCGEVMMPYEETSNLSVQEIKEMYNVSDAQAKYRKKY